jgi:hypothetical protein
MIGLCHIWLNILGMIAILSKAYLDDHHLGYIKEFLRKTMRCQPGFSFSWDFRALDWSNRPLLNGHFSFLS